MDNDAIRKAAKKVLEDPDFQQAQEPNPVMDWLKTLSDDLWKILRGMFNFGSPGDLDAWRVVGVGLKVLLIVLAVVAAGFILKWLYERYFQRQRPRIEAYAVTRTQRQEAQELYARLASEALQSQDYRLAIHYLFLAAVSQVIRDADFNGAEFMTNREIAGASDFSRFGNPRQISELFNAMIQFDEPRWFGNADISEQDYRQFDGFYSQFAAVTRTEGGKTHA
jgi:hypothetical protein